WEQEKHYLQKPGLHKIREAKIMKMFGESQKIMVKTVVYGHTTQKSARADPFHNKQTGKSKRLIQAIKSA
ncbi:MAG: hypothetical protein WC269_03140, partial [Candidatus Gracilibacteria bacterium]